MEDTEVSPATSVRESDEKKSLQIAVVFREQYKLGLET